MPFSSRHMLLASIAALGGWLAFSTSSASSATIAASATKPAALSPAAQLGKQLFFDPRLSASGQLACASCHDPAHAYGPPDGQDTRLGGPHMNRQGTRAVPSLRYKAYTPMYSEHYYIGHGEDMDDEGPTGGFTADGRANSLAAQAAIPLLDPNEMANESRTAAVNRLAASPNAAAFRAVFGKDIFSNPDKAFAGLTRALESFQQEDPSFQPYSSKFDRYLRHEVTLSAQEERGLLLFNRSDKGNCAQCHISRPGPNSRPPQFTDYGFEALGVPRNMRLQINHDAHYYDMGLCGPARTDLATRKDLCGLFKTPTLRNVASRKVFFHNGSFHDLEATLHFYAERDHLPGKWYPSVHGKVQQFDDLPVALRGNIDHRTAPMNRKPGEAPLLNDSEIKDLLAFLQTLNDADTLPARPGK